jgi:hypothetical protein
MSLSRRGWHKSLNSNTYGVQLFVFEKDGFAKYEWLKNDIIAILESNGFLFDKDDW